MVSLINCITLKEETIPILHKFYHKTEKEGTLFNLFYGARITLIPKPAEDIAKKKKNYRQIKECRQKKSLEKLLNLI